MSQIILPEMVRIPAGEFVMGAPAGEEESSADEHPQHKVRVETFELGQYPVTFAEWDAAVNSGARLHRPDDRDGGRDRRPVTSVSWEDAQAYISWLNSKTSGGYRLPSEAEWEYACRAGATTPYSFEGGVERLGSYAWFDDNANSMAQPVGEKLPNPWGLHDMHGNVWEWVEDRLHEDYAGAPDDGSAWITGGDASQRMLRGGSWYNHPGFLRSANRDWVNHSTRDDTYGFRLARVAR